MFRYALFLAAFLLSPIYIHADDSPFHSGPLIMDYGKIATIQSDMPIPDGAILRVSFDMAKQAEEGTTSRNLETIARFLNMHVEAGVQPENLQVAVVIHGGASNDLMSNKAYKARYGSDNANTALLRELLKHNVEIIICGQSATYHDVAKSDLEPGVKMALSAMTAHALLQQDGYTLNPF